MPFKVYVDSRFRQDTGGSTSDTQFSIELPHPINVKGRAFIDTCLIPNTFYVIRANENDRIHIRENTGTYRIPTIAPGQYNAETLAVAVKDALISGKSIAGSYTVVYDIPSNKLVIRTTDAAATFHIFPTGWLKANSNTWNTNSFAGGGPLVNVNNLMSAGSVTGLATGTVILSGNLATKVTPGDVVNTQPYHQLFIRSSLGNGYDAIGPDGSSDIVRRVTCQVPLNDIIVDQHGLSHDSITVGNREISSLSFTVTDCFGKVVDTNGHHISFSIIFLEDD